MRNLTKSLLAASLVSSANVYALGIGEIKLHSALNQNLNAEIALIAPEGEDLSKIRVKLAPPAKFDQAGIPWSYFLSKIHFTPITKPNGSVVIKATSSEALKEPFLNFMLEVNSSKGVQYREFTVLVDPPASYKRNSATARNATGTIVSPENYRVRQTRPNYDASDDAIETRLSADTYGPISSTDTLWSIANKVKPEGVTTAQMVMALFERNPGAFSQANVNAMRSGEILQIPSRQAALKFPAHKALADFKHQRSIYNPSTKTAPTKLASKPAAPIKPKTQTPQSSLAPIARTKPSSEKSGTPKTVKAVLPPPLNRKTVPQRQQLTLAAPEELNPPISTSKTSNNKPTLESPEDIAATKAIAAREQELLRESKEVEERFKRIEQQLAMMQKLLDVKNEQLNALQNQNTLLTANNPVPGANPTQPALLPELQPPEPPSVISQAPQNADKLAISAPPPVTPAPIKLDTPPPPPPPVLPTKVATSTTTEPISDSNDSIDFAPLIAGLGTAILGALGWLWWRKRTDSTDNAAPENLFPPAKSVPEANSETPKAKFNFTPPPNERVNVGVINESAFLSEFTPSEFDGFETEHADIDPIAEADVYLAYGRYQQAEELIRQAIIEHPDNDECKLKLLEIFQVNDNKVDFNKYVQELAQQGKQSDLAFWTKVIEMGGLINVSPDSAVSASNFDTPNTPNVELNKFDKLAFANNLNIDTQPQFNTPTSLTLNEKAASFPAQDLKSWENPSLTASMPEDLAKTLADFDNFDLTANDSQPLTGGLDALSSLVMQDDLDEHALADNAPLEFKLGKREELKTQAPAPTSYFMDDPNAIDFNFESLLPEQIRQSSTGLHSKELDLDTLNFPVKNPATPTEENLFATTLSKQPSSVESIPFDFDATVTGLNKQTTENSYDELLNEPSSFSIDDDDDEFDLEAFNIPTSSTSKLSEDAKAQNPVADSLSNFDFDDFNLTTESEEDDDDVFLLGDNDDQSLDITLETISPQHNLPVGRSNDPFKQEDRAHNALDFNLDDFFDTNSKKSSAPALDFELDQQDRSDGLKNFDFDFSLDDIPDEIPQTLANVKTNNTEADLLSSLDFSLNDLGNNSKQSKAKTDAFDFDFDFDFDLPKGSGLADLDEQSDPLSVDDLTDGSGALDTKINLANAYIDMGDLEAARKIAETLLQGSPKYQDAAKAILKKTG